MLPRLFVLVFCGLAAAATPAGAQVLTLDHPGQYSHEDIARGSLLYTARCAVITFALRD